MSRHATNSSPLPEPSATVIERTEQLPAVTDHHMLVVRVVDGVQLAGRPKWLGDDGKRDCVSRSGLPTADAFR